MMEGEREEGRMGDRWVGGSLGQDRRKAPESSHPGTPTLLRVLGAGQGRGAHDPAIGDIGDGGCVASPTWQTSGLRLGEAD